MHAYAAKDPLFHAIADIQASDFAGEGGQFCTQCHTVPGFLNGETVIYAGPGGTPRQKTTGLSPVAQMGVSCDVCHSATLVLRQRNAELLFVPDGTIHGPFGDPVPNDFHQSLESPLHRKGDLCAACHDVDLPFNFRDVPLESTGREWQQYLAKGGDQQCQDCHMPSYMGQAAVDGPIRTVHSHTFVGVDMALVDFPAKQRQREMVEQLARKTVEMTIAPRADGFNAKLTNITGHSVPSGVTSERRVWLEAKLRDALGAVVYQTGMLDSNGDLMDGVPDHTINPGGDPDLWWFGSVVTNSTGLMGTHLVTFPHQSDAIDEHLLLPRSSATHDFKFPVLASGSYTLSVRVLLRAVQPFFMRALEKHPISRISPTLKDAIPTLVLAEASLPIAIP